MAGDGASEIKPEHVTAAIADRSQKIKMLDAQLAAGAPITEQRLARLWEHRAAISADISDLTTVLEGVRRGDLAFTEQIPPDRLEELLAARNERTPSLGGVPLEKMLEIRLASRAFRLACEEMAGPDATPSPIAGVEEDAGVPEVISRDDGAAPPVLASARECLARLQI